MQERIKKDKEELENAKLRLEAQTRQRAQFKYGAFSRIQLKPSEYEVTPEVAKALLVDKTILEKCVPIKVGREIANVESAQSRLMSINNEIESCDYGSGFYSHIPDVDRGNKRNQALGPEDSWVQA